MNLQVSSSHIFHIFVLAYRQYVIYNVSCFNIVYFDVLSSPRIRSAFWRESKHNSLPWYRIFSAHRIFSLMLLIPSQHPFCIQYLFKGNKYSNFYDQSLDLFLNFMLLGSYCKTYFLSAFFQSTYCFCEIYSCCNIQQ